MCAFNKLIFFNASPESNFIQTAWTTLSEKNNSGFEIERSDAGGEFKVIGWINGAGSSTIPHSYHFADRNVFPNTIYYYRLHQIDFDGHSFYSQTVAAQLHGSVINASVYPNPVKEESLLTYYLEEDATISISLINALGQEIQLQESMHQSQGQQHLQLKIKKLHLAAGIYTLRIRVNERSEFLKLIITSD